MKIGLAGAATHRLKLSYVTESPSWKPSYRLVMDKPGKVDVQGWAVVDNTSGEDWKRIKLGVGSSSAMSFRYDLHTVRTGPARDAPLERSVRAGAAGGRLDVRPGRRRDAGAGRAQRLQPRQ